MGTEEGQPGFDTIQAKNEIDALYESLAAGDTERGSEIIRSMGDNKNALALEPLIILLEYHDEPIRNSAAIALGKIGDEAAVGPLIRALKDETRRVQASAAWSLGEIGDIGAIAALENMDISKDTPALMNTVRKSVGKIKARSAAEKNLYSMEPPGAVHIENIEKKKEPQAAASVVKAVAIGANTKGPLVALLILAIIVAVIAGAFAYSIVFPPVWAEKLPYKNSTGQYQSIIVYRNATDTTYYNLTQFLDVENTSIKNDVFNDDDYKCVEYAVRLHDDAEKAQINCSIIGTGLRGDVPEHALVAFYTKDRGPVYIDPTSTNVSQANLPGSISIDRVVLLRDKWRQKMPIWNPMGNVVTTTEYRNAGPVTYDRLMAFLSNDSTETGIYVDPSYTCSDFATRLHDAAEEQGIKCAIVSISFADNKTPCHAFNAFPTTDKGIVYIDDTGLNSSEKENGGLASDAVVYLQPGQELGELPANQTNGCLDYGFYVQRKDKIRAYIEEWQAYMDDGNYYLANKSHYESEVGQFNKDAVSYENDVSQYNAAVKQYDAGNSAYSLDYLNAWKARLDTQHSNLDEKYNSLERVRNLLNYRRDDLLKRYDALRSREEAKWFINHPIGIVEDTYIYW